VSSRAKSVAVDALAWIDPPLLTHRTIAGRSYEVLIGDRATALTLPSEGPDNLSWPSSPRGPTRTFPRPPLARAITHGVEMHSTSERALPREILAVDNVRLRWSDISLEHAAGEFGSERNLAEELGTWLSTVRDWLSVWSHNVRERAQLEPTPRVRVALANDPDAGTVSGGGTRPVFILGERASTPVELRAAFAAASSGTALPLPRKLLSEAIVHAARHEHRHAVISACSAAEVVLSESASGALAGAGRTDDEISDILAGVNGVVELYRLNASRPAGLGVSIRRVMDQLARPRNRAVHEGGEPDQETARRAIRTAVALLEISPFPSPQSLLQQSRPQTSTRLPGQAPRSPTLAERTD
jgi:hypothetical protein